MNKTPNSRVLNPSCRNGLKIEYLEPDQIIDQTAAHKRLTKFITLFAQIGYKELYLNPKTSIKFDLF